MGLSGEEALDWTGFWTTCHTLWNCWNKMMHDEDIVSLVILGVLIVMQLVLKLLLSRTLQ
jgi:hypothetical protein